MDDFFSKLLLISFFASGVAGCSGLKFDVEKSKEGLSDIAQNIEERDCRDYKNEQDYNNCLDRVDNYYREQDLNRNYGDSYSE